MYLIFGIASNQFPTISLEKVNVLMVWSPFGISTGADHRSLVRNQSHTKPLRLPGTDKLTCCGWAALRKQGFPCWRCWRYSGREYNYSTGTTLLRARATSNLRRGRIGIVWYHLITFPDASFCCFERPSLTKRTECPTVAVAHLRVVSCDHLVKVICVIVAEKVVLIYLERSCD